MSINTGEESDIWEAKDRKFYRGSDQLCEMLQHCQVQGGLGHKCWTEQGGKNSEV